MESTVYKFEINYESFPHSLDIFSQFFKRPSFTENAIAREVMAVDAEDSKNRILDSRRVLQVTKDLIIKDHPYAKFSTGNVRTLAYGDAEMNAPDLSKAMRNFHLHHYKPENMALCLAGPQSIEELKNLAIEHFSNIYQSQMMASTDSIVNEKIPINNQNQPNSEEFKSNENIVYNNQHHDGFPFREDVLGSIIRIKPIKDVRDLSILWGVPPTRNLYRKNPYNLIGYLLSQKGPNSIFAILQDKGLAMSNSAGVSTEYNDFSFFEVSISLTEKGLKQWEDVVDIIYSYLHLISEMSDQEIVHAWNEIKATNSIDFSYRDKATVYELAPYIAGNMLTYPLEHIISKGWLLDDIDIIQFREYVSKLIPRTSLTMLRSRDFSWLPNDSDSTGTSTTTHTTSPSLSAIESRNLVEVVDNNIQLIHNEEIEIPRNLFSMEMPPTDTPVGVGPNRKEKWYQVPYHCNKYDISSAKRWKMIRNGKKTEDSDYFKLPAPNNYICYELASNISTIVNVNNNNNNNNNNQGTSSNLHNDQQVSVESMSNSIISTESDVSVDNKQVILPLKSKPPKVIFEQSHSEKTLDPSMVSSIEYNKLPFKFWHSMDEVFQQPKATVYYLLHTSECADGNPINSLIASIYSQVATRNLYYAGVAGLSYGFNVGPRGLSLSLSGYSPKLSELASKVFQDVMSISFWQSIDPKVIDLCKERLLRGLKSWQKERPDTQCDSLLSYILTENSWLPNEVIEAAESITFDKMTHRIQSALRTRKITGYIHGNMNDDTSVDFYKNSLNIFQKMRSNTNSIEENKVDGSPVKESSSVSVSVSMIPDETGDVPSRARILPPRHTVVAVPVLNDEDPNSALVTYIQTDVTSPRNSALMMVLRSIMAEPLFSELRTKKQLGYIVQLSSSGYGRFVCFRH